MSNPDDRFPRALLSLSDSELTMLMAAAAPLPLVTRPAFLEAVAARAQCLPAIGPGSLHRLLREAQAEFLNGKPIDGTGKPPTPAISAQARPCRSGRPRKPSA